MKRNVLSLFLALLLAFSLSACNGATTATQTLYQRGMEVVSLLDEMVGNENYLRVYSASDEMLQLLRPVAEGDYTAPKAVYRLSFANDDLLSVATGELSSSLDLPDTLTSYLQSRVPSVLISQLNAQSGAEVLAASTLCTGGKTFLYTEEIEACIYLYTFESGSPVAVAFTSGEDNTVSATGSFILNDTFSPDSEDAIRTFFGELPMQVETVTE